MKNTLTAIARYTWTIEPCQITKDKEYKVFKVLKRAKGLYIVIVDDGGRLIELHSNNFTFKED